MPPVKKEREFEPYKTSRSYGSSRKPAGAGEQGVETSSLDRWIKTTVVVSVTLGTGCPAKKIFRVTCTSWLTEAAATSKTKELLATI